MKTFTIYDTTTGEIKFVEGYGNPARIPEVSQDEAYIVGEYDTNTIYFVNDIPTPRPAMGISINKLSATADGIDLIIVSGVPNGVQALVVEGFQSLLYELVTDGTVEVGSEYPISPKISLKLFPYIDEEFQVELL